VYGNQNRNSIMFKEELAALKNRYMSRFQLIHILSREKTDADINSGRIDRYKCDSLFDSILSISADEFFICGPEQMIFSVKNFLEERYVDPERIHFELFNTTKTKHATSDIHHSGNDSGPKSSITVKLDGRSFEFELGFGGQNILDAALQQGADLPYACKGGVCCTCKAKLVEGEVDMEVNWGLEKEEIEQGYILTCQAHPKTSTVVVDFDVK
jgi:ring-1,2-phenylacetyl-CoA epoxidase subunit PaaE